MNVLKRKYQKESQVEPISKRNSSGERKFTIVGNNRWQLKINQNEPWKSSICEISKGNSTFNEWYILPSAELGVVDDWFGEINPDTVFIAQNFMMICFKEKFLLLNLRTRKLFWIGENELDTKIQ